MKSAPNAGTAVRRVFQELGGLDHWTQLHLRSQADAKATRAFIEIVASSVTPRIVEALAGLGIKARGARRGDFEVAGRVGRPGDWIEILIVDGKGALQGPDAMILNWTLAANLYAATR